VALPVVALLVAVLTVFSLTAASYLVASNNIDRRHTADTRAVYVAELGRADAFAYVLTHPGITGWPYTRPPTTLYDAWGHAVGEYTYTITNLTLPEQNPRAHTEVLAYWPTQAEAVVGYRLDFWMEEDGGTWAVTAWALTKAEAGS